MKNKLREGENVSLIISSSLLSRNTERLAEDKKRFCLCSIKKYLFFSKKPELKFLKQIEKYSAKSMAYFLNKWLLFF